MTLPLEMTHDEVAAAELAELRRAHRALDDEIAARTEQGPVCSFEMQQLKRRKLKLKDEIRVLSDRLTPDIIA